MNEPSEEDYIKAINDNPENRDYQLLFAEYLQEKGEDNLAEGWRVLVRDGKKPELNEEGTYWWWDAKNYPQNFRDPHKLDFITGTTLGYQDSFTTYFGAMQAAAVAYVRHTYDENYGKECPICNGDGIVIFSNQVYFVKCPNCEGKGVIG